MKKIFSFLNKYHLPLLSGLLVGTSYIPLPPWAILFCYAPLWWFWSKQDSPKAIFWGGFWAQFILNAIGFHWILITAHDFGQLPWPVAALAFLAFAALAHLYIPLVGLIHFSAKRWGLIKSGAHEFFFIAGLWSLSEIFWPYIFQWHLGYTLIWGQFPIYQFADVIGFQGLAFVLSLFNAAVAASFLIGNNKPAFFRRTAQLIVIFFLLNVMGSIWGFNFKRQHPQFNEKNILVVQGNIGNLERLYAERGTGYQDHIAKTYFTATQKGLENLSSQGQTLDLIVWPESAYPEYLDPDSLSSRRAQLLSTQIRSWQTPLITGSYSKDPLGSKPRLTYNALSLFDSNGVLSVDSPYQKYQLLAFGEYTPFSKLFPILEKISPAGSGFGRGSGPRNLSLSNLTLGPQICYEALYPEHSQVLAKAGAEIIINVTNDSWFGTTFEPEQHLYMTFARAIENRLPLIRATNTGLTTAIQADGEILNTLKPNTEDLGVFKMKLYQKSSLTLFTKFGHLLPILLLIFTGAIIVYQKSQKS